MKIWTIKAKLWKDEGKFMRPNYALGDIGVQATLDES
jgi:hypothetical protein